MVIAQVEILTNKYVQIILNSKFFEVWKSIAIGVGIFVLLMFLRNIFAKYIIKILDSMFKALKIKSARKILNAFEKPIKMAFIVMGVYIFMSILSSSMGWSIRSIINKFLGTSIIVLFANGLINITNNSDDFLFRATDKYDIKVNTVLIPMMSKGIKYLIIAFAIIQIANIWGLDVNAFITGIGLGGVVIALAAKDFAANMMSGVIIFMDNPFTIGDWVKCKEIEGIVEDISFRSTRIRTFDKVLITVPNSLLVNDSILNFNKRELRRVTMDIGVTYDTSTEQLQKCVSSIKDMLKNHDGVDSESIHVSFSTLNESSLDISMYFFINKIGFNEYMEIKEDINYSIMKILSDEEVSIAFPTKSVYIENK
ncbi:small-conductance mechanosensitive channel protein MscY [Clostridium subterminale]|uniref:Small-conductance mechanosensitive channel protein MscY n=1 Tax=Clostridium subterminale TaxID=1550 RepID=A0ABP3WCH4_CLOSU